MSDLQVTPLELRHAASELQSLAEELRSGMAALDTEVGTVVGGSWSGDASSAFGDIWREWHSGAAQITDSLTVLSSLLDRAASGYDGTDAAGAATLGESGV